MSLIGDLKIDNLLSFSSKHAKSSGVFKMMKTKK